MGDRFDVAIVGAGPAGCSTALHLLRLAPRARVVLIDRAALPRIKPCGGAVSRWGLEVLESIGLSLDALGVDGVPIRKLRVRVRNAVGEHELPMNSRPLGVVLRRDVFDGALARAASKRGATVLPSHKLVRLTTSRAGVRLDVECAGTTSSIEASLAVGADGTGSAVRRLGGFGEPGRRARLIVTETEHGVGDDLVCAGGGALEFDLSGLDARAGDGALPGYAWHFATRIDGHDRVSRGLYAFIAPNRRSDFALKIMLDRRLLERGVDPSRAHAAHYTERVFVDPRASIAGPRVALVGEAAGLVDPITGEGIAQAIASGAVAASHLARALAGGRALDVAAYETEIAALRSHRHLRQTAAIVELIYGRHGAQLAAALARSSAAVEAGAAWYAGDRVGFASKLAAATSVAARLARDRMSRGFPLRFPALR